VKGQENVKRALEVAAEFAFIIEELNDFPDIADSIDF